MFNLILYICRKNKDMEKEFVTYELSLRLKALGYDEPCLAAYNSKGEYEKSSSKHWNNDSIRMINAATTSCLKVLAPLWQQAFDWFREKYKLDSWVFKYYDYDVDKELYKFNLRTGDFYSSFYNTYDEARLACLEKLIEIVKENKK